MSKFQIGIIGAGMIADRHIENFLKTGKANIKWLADLKPEAMANLASKHRIPQTSDDYHDILNDPEVDSVVICTPPSSHKQIYLDSVTAGKHVLIEKPAAMSLAGIDEMIALAARHPEVKICDCSARHSRLQPKFRIVKKMIEEGKPTQSEKQ